jgi:hypothetical protein
LRYKSLQIDPRGYLRPSLKSEQQIAPDTAKQTNRAREPIVLLYIVEIRSIGGEIGSPLAAMRAWFDRHGFEPVSLRYSTGGAGITFRVDFYVEDQAVALARRFSGRLLGTANNAGTPLWQTQPEVAAEAQPANT